jgi:hypothetical protein
MEQTLDSTAEYCPIAHEVQFDAALDENVPGLH